MRTIQIQLLLSNTLHRQLFIANLLKRYEVGRRASVSTTIVCRRGASVREKGGKKKKDAERGVGETAARDKESANILEGVEPTAFVFAGFDEAGRSACR